MRNEVEVEAILDEVEGFQQYVRLESINAAKNRRRFYTLAWQPALFDGWALVRIWGRLGTSGRVRQHYFLDRDDAYGLIIRLLRRRLQRGYAVTAWQ